MAISEDVQQIVASIQLPEGLVDDANSRIVLQQDVESACDALDNEHAARWLTSCVRRLCCTAHVLNDQSVANERVHDHVTSATDVLMFGSGSNSDDGSLPNQNRRDQCDEVLNGLLGKLSNYACDAPLTQAVLDTMIRVRRRPNARYYRALAASCSSRAWAVMWIEMVARTLHERGNVYRNKYDVGLMGCLHWNASDPVEGTAHFVNRVRTFEDAAMKRAVQRQKVTTPFSYAELSRCVQDGPRRAPLSRANPPRKLVAYVLNDEFWTKFGCHLVQAGGSVCEMLHDGYLYRRGASYRPKVDIDLFIHGLRTHEDGLRIVKEALRHIKARVVRYNKEVVEEQHQQPTYASSLSVLVDVTMNSVNVTLIDAEGVPVLELQFVMRLFSSVQQLLLFFDIGPSCFAFDGTRFHATLGALYASANGFYVVNPTLQSYPTRMGKYTKRGYLPVVPRVSGLGACMEHVQCSSTDELRRVLRMYNLASVLAFVELGRRTREDTDYNYKYLVSEDAMRGGDLPGLPAIVSIEKSHGRNISSMMKFVRCEKLRQEDTNAVCELMYNKGVAFMLYLDDERQENDHVNEEALDCCEDDDTDDHGDVAAIVDPSKRVTKMRKRVNDAMLEAKRWKLGKPLVNLANDDDGSDVLALAHVDTTHDNNKRQRTT